MDQNQERALALKQAAYLKRTAEAIVLAYETASADNGGPDEVDWDDMDEACELAHKALGRKACKALTDQAKYINGVDVKPLGVAYKTTRVMLKAKNKAKRRR